MLPWRLLFIGHVSIVAEGNTGIAGHGTVTVIVASHIVINVTRPVYDMLSLLNIGADIGYIGDGVWNDHV